MDEIEEKDAVEIESEKTIDSNEKKYCKVFVFQRGDIIMRVNNVDGSHPMFSRKYFYKDVQQINLDANRVIGAISLRTTNKSERPLYVFSDGDSDSKFDTKSEISREGTKTYEQIIHTIKDDILEDGEYLTINNDKKIYPIRDIILEKVLNQIDENQYFKATMYENILNSLEFGEALQFAIEQWCLAKNMKFGDVLFAKIKEIFYNFLTQLNENIGMDIPNEYKIQRRFDLTANYDDFYKKLSSFIEENSENEDFCDFAKYMFIDNKIIKNENKLKNSQNALRKEKEKLLLLLELDGLENMCKKRKK